MCYLKQRWGRKPLKNYFCWLKNKKCGCWKTIKSSSWLGLLLQSPPQPPISRPKSPLTSDSLCGRWALFHSSTVSVSSCWHVLVSDWNRLVHPAGQKHHLHQELHLLPVGKCRGQSEQTDQHDCGRQQDLRQPQWGVLQVSASWEKSSSLKGYFTNYQLAVIRYNISPQ